MKFIFLATALLATSCRSRPPVHSGPPKNIHVEGHRGARALFPENTLPAFEFALKSGVDVLEMDLAVTADHHVVISHESYVNSGLCSYDDGKEIQAKPLFKNLTLAQVKKFTCGLKPHPRFPKQQKIKTSIPTLEEVFSLVSKSKFPSAKTVKFNIETKIDPDHPDATWDVDTFVKDVLHVVDKSGFKKRVIVQSFDFRSLRRIQELDSSIKLAALTEDNVNPLQALGNLKVHILSPNFKTIDLEIVEKAQQHGMLVVPWTVNEARDWEDMINLRVDGIISDDPQALLIYLREKGFHP